MAVFTSKADGNWSASGTTTWTQTGVPGSGDTVTVSHNITVDVNTTIGSSPSTGGTAAIAFSTSVGGKTLTVATGVTLTLLGDMLLSATDFSSTNLVMGLGSSIVLKPPSGQQYVLNCDGDGSSSTVYGNLVINGTSGSHCTVKTDKSSGGLACYINTNSSHFAHQGILTATYCDFIDLGTTTHWGVQTMVSYPAVSPANTSITNCTFTRCSYQGEYNSQSPTYIWDGNATFSNNSFTSSITNTLSGTVSACFFGFGVAASSGTRVCQANAFDDNVVGDFGWTTFNGNLINGSSIGLGIGNTMAPATAANCAGNVISYDSAIAGAYPVLTGPFKDWYFFNRASTNPHYVGVAGSVVNGIVIGCIFEDGGATPDGDCIIPTTGSTATLSVTNCIVLPNAAGLCSGKLISALATGIAITAEHNTVFSRSAEGGGVLVLGETSSSYAGEVVSCRANLVYSDASSTAVLAIGDLGTPATNAVTLAGYNGFWNPNTGTCHWNTTTSQSGVTGYSAVTVSLNHNYPNTAVGTGDFTANPSFVDVTRDLASWGGTTAGGGVATVAGAIATLAANTDLIGQASTGLLDWVRAGFVPTNAAYKAASYAGDTSTTDAAGNAWAGGSPGVGAMSFAAGGGSSYGSGRSSMSTRRAALSGAQVTRVYG